MGGYKMQNSHLKLKEIIWELTGKCNNRCEYCGSKDAWKVTINPETIVKIAENIAKFPPEEIDISGGDPLLVNFAVNEQVVKVLKDKNVKCKIIINPKSIMKADVGVLGLYDWIGVSINTEEELNLLLKGFTFLNKSTIISNFNLQNIFLYDKIQDFVKTHNLTWQVQYTVFKESEKTLALYENQPSLDFFFTKIKKSIENGVKIVLADNMNTGNCGAGLCSLGILYTGDIVPCLSMRSWVEDINSLIVGNILGNEGCSDNFKNNPLKYIWENRFNKYRFECFKCCKDHCKNKAFNLYKDKSSLEDLFKIVRVEEDESIKNWPSRPFPGTGIMYGCTPNVVQVYAVITDPHEGTYMYACPAPKQWYTTSTTESKTYVQDFDTQESNNK